jgi:hypothetical protein
MNMMDILNQAGGIGAIARELGVDEGTAATGAAALLPAILGGFKGQAQQQPEGLGGLIGMLGGMGGGGLLASVLGAGPSNVDAGNNVLGQIFGSKDVSRSVAADASAKSGISGDLLKKMLRRSRRDARQCTGRHDGRWSAGCAAIIGRYARRTRLTP